MAFGPTERRELRRLLREFRASHAAVSVPGGEGKALEAWVLMRMAKSARQHGWAVSLRQGDGTALPARSAFKFRLQPGKIAASRASAVGYVSLVPPNPTQGTALELHGGIQWRGRSFARHECDISMLPATIGDAIRKSGGGYPRGLPIVAIECKDKGASGSPDEMRETVARLFDLACISQNNDGHPHRIFTESLSAGWGWRASMYRPFFAQGQFGIVRATGFGLGARQLSEHYNIGRYSRIYDRVHGRAMGALLGRFQQILDWLG